ncbi:MAG: hypothetical protein RDU14_02445 [Melioribacteraceae bacterium]|nr:hypothetical protein [Melioribacteraceae bacterium]
MKKIIVLLIGMIVFFSLFETSFGIPAFGRKYNMSCQTCHSPFPRLKDYGEEFAGNGFVLSDKDAPRYFLKTGDDDLSLLREIPVALRVEGYVTYNNKNSDQSDITAPYLLKFLSGGSIAPDIAYYFYFFFSERGEVAGIEDAFIMFNDLFGTDLDLYVGQFQVSDPLFKRELRLTFEDYQIYKTTAGFSNSDLTYDRGIMLTYGLPTGTDFTLEILNGTGIGHANILRNFDNDKYKNVMVRISQDVAEGFRIGGFGYFGKEKLKDDLNNSFENSLRIFGPDLTLKLKDQLEFNFQYVARVDDMPTAFATNIKSNGGFAELIYTPKGDESKWYGVALYNWVKSDIKDLEYQTGTLSLGYMLRRNIRFIGELTYNIDKKYAQFSTGIIAAF